MSTMAMLRLSAGVTALLLVGSMSASAGVSQDQTSSATSATSIDLDHDLRDNCDRPTPPPPLDGATATEVQLNASHDLVTAFLAASDHYQRCIRRFVGERETLAYSVQSVVPKWVYAVAQSKIDANQKDKEVVGKGYNDAVLVYRTRQPQ